MQKRDELVFCCDCDFMRLDNENDPPWRALCTKHRNIGGYGFVSKDRWDTEKPYLRCVDMNPRGSCPLFEPKKEVEDEHQ